MGTSKKSNDWKYIEECIGYIKQNDEKEENILRIERALSRIFDIEFKVLVSDNTTGEFYGVHVFPTYENLNKVSKAILVDKSESANIVSIWQTSPMWYIEIDSILISDISKSFNPSDIVSLMIHEIMRTIYSDVSPRIINDVFRYEYMKLNAEMRALFSNAKIQQILNLVIIESCVSKCYNYINDDNVELKICEDAICKFGYKDDYNRTLDKIIRYFNNDLINRTYKEVKKDLTVVINWAIENIRQLECTKEDLKYALKTEMLRTNSTIVKNYIRKLYRFFFEGIISQYRVLLSEQFTDTPKDVVSEIQAMESLMTLYKKIVTEASGNIFDKNGKIKKISQLDIDVLSVDAERIETADDKIYLLDRLYIMLQTVEAGLEYLESDNKMDKSKVTQSKSTLLDMQKQLLRLREQILATRIIEKEYGVFVKYPKGYER